MSEIDMEKIDGKYRTFVDALRAYERSTNIETFVDLLDAKYSLGLALEVILYRATINFVEDGSGSVPLSTRDFYASETEGSHIDSERKSPWKGVGEVGP